MFRWSREVNTNWKSLFRRYSNRSQQFYFIRITVSLYKSILLALLTVSAESRWCSVNFFGLSLETVPVIRTPSLAHFGYTSKKSGEDGTLNSYPSVHQMDPQLLHCLLIHLENRLSSDIILVLLIYTNYQIRLILQKSFLPGLSGMVSVTPNLPLLDFIVIRPRIHCCDSHGDTDKRAHSKPVTCVQFNPENSNIFASSGYDRETKIFNFKNGETVFSSESFPAHLGT